MTRTSAETTATIEKVAETERRWAKHLLAGNVKELSEMMADEFYLVTHLGSVVSKKEILEMIATRKCVFSEIIFVDSEAQVFSDCVLVRRSWLLKVKIENRYIDGRTISSALWVHTPTGFKITMVHTTDATLIDNWARLSRRT